MEHTVPDARDAWPVGQRVHRKDTGERGTVIENARVMKVKWDQGRTSYFRHDVEANVQLELAQE